MRRALLCPLLLAGLLRAGEPQPPAVRPELEACLKLPDERFDFGRAACLIAREEHPALDLEKNLARLDALAERLRAELAKSGTVQGKLGALKRLLFETEGYGLPEKDDAAAFLLSDVLANKRGNCLGLSALCLALAERVGLKLHGVPVPSRHSGPGHLLVRYDDGTARVNFDPTERGAAHPDAHYAELFKLRPEDLKDGYILGNAAPKQVANLLLVNLGGARVEAGRAAEAVPLLDLALGLQPRYAPALQNLGAARLQLGDAAGAEAAFKQALALQPGLAGARLGLAEAALHRGDPGAAEAEALAVLGEEPENRQAQSLLANVYLHRREYKAAIAQLKGVARAAPRDPSAHCNLGTACALAGEFAEAEAAFREALRADPKHADAHFGLGEVLRATGQTDEARKAYAQALELEPDHLKTRLAQAEFALTAGNLKDAEAAYRAALNGRPGQAQALKGLADVLLKQGRAREAQELLAQAPAPAGDAQAALLAGEAKLKAGDAAGALKVFEAALQGAPEAARVPLLQRVAVCQGKLQRHREAFETAQEILKLAPEDLAALRIAAAACEGLRNAPRAVEFYRRILGTVPGDEAAAKALRRLGAK
ncbi:MAG: tetratricopeptide repeat protein [Planctomycetota bacterium]|nr:tetratricopeptide repeat protein [Planctomycetota bacterium]